MKYFYEKNTELIQHSVNKKFEEILAMTDYEFRAWCVQLRKVVVYLWDEKGIPPRVGYDENGIIDNFEKLIAARPYDLLVKDELTGEKNVIRNTTIVGNAVNQWFPTMMKTRINYSKKDNGKSIYDFFAREDLLDTFITYATRHFRRDSFYAYSRPVEQDKVVEISGRAYRFTNAKEFLQAFKATDGFGGKYGYWYDKRDKKEYSGYNEELKGKKYLRTDEGQIRMYEYGQRLFPVGLKAFRVSFCQYAVNFPPLTARYLYERYTEKIKGQSKIVVYDPSAGWAGRLLGAMAVDSSRNIHYIGTDPNTDHNIGGGRTKYHDVADFFNNKTSRAISLFPTTHTYEIYQHGSEVIANDENFKKWKGKVDLVFTSPPYFAKEAYSEDPTQSYKKFNQYEAWREGFLRPTLETAVKWLRKDRYLLWNIADAVFGGEMLPLEQDSNDILKSLGMEHVETLKMALAQMPGGNRIDEETGKPKAKNFVKVDGLWLKYEPIFVWRKL